MTSYRIALMNPIGQHPFDRSIDLPPHFLDALLARQYQPASLDTAL
jgi:hypothetical protein